MTFLAGACHLSKNPAKYKDIFENTVNGQIKNVYSSYDRLLYLYHVSRLQTDPIGRNPVSFGEDADAELVQNFDVSQSFGSKRLSGGMGHLDYMEKLHQTEISMKIDLR